MLQAAVQRWSGVAIHDTVAEIVRDRSYRRSIIGSLLGRAMVAIFNAVNRLIEAFRGMPGGKLTVIIVLVVILGVVIARAVYGTRMRDDELLRRRGVVPRASRADLWIEAERMAADGDYTGAAHALYQAVLRRLAGSERIRVHASKTSGDYSRELRRRGSPVAQPFQQFGRRFDRVIFGVGECSPEEFAAMLREASAVTERQVA